VLIRDIQFGNCYSINTAFDRNLYMFCTCTTSCYPCIFMLYMSKLHINAVFHFWPKSRTSDGNGKRETVLSGDSTVERWNG